MKTVRNNFFILLVFLSSCKDNNEIKKNSTISVDNIKDIYNLDISGDSEMEVIEIETVNYKRKIFYNKYHFLTILPLYKKEFVTTFPPIENIYIQANKIQSKEKSFKLIVRNTDFQPDCYFIDIKLIRDQFYIESYGVINTNDSTYIKTIYKIHKLSDIVDSKYCINLKSFIDENLILN